MINRDDWPKSAYMNSMDAWQIISYLNVFFVLVEYCLVLWLSSATPLEEIDKDFSKKRIKKEAPSFAWVPKNVSISHRTY